MIDRPAAANRAQLLFAGLHIAGIVDCATLNQHGLAVPDPVDVEAGQAFAQDRCLEPCAAPIASAIDRDIDLFHLAAARPSQTADTEETLVEQNLPARWRRHHALAFLDARILAVQPAGHQVNIMERLVLAAIRLIADLDAAQVLDPADALHTRHDQAQRVAVFGTQHFAVLAIGHKNLAAFDQLHRHRACHRRAISALGEDEAAALVVDPGHVKQDFQGHARELAAAQHAMRVLARRHGHIAPFHPGIGAAFDEVEAADRRQAHQLVHGEDQRLLQHLVVRAIDHQAMFGRVDVPPTLMMALEMQAAGRDDAEQRLQGCERNRRLGRLRQPGARAALDIGLEAGRFAIAIGGYRLTQSARMGWQLKDVGISSDGRWVGQRHWRSGCRSRSEEGLTDEVTAPGLGFGNDLLHRLGVEKVLRCLEQATHHL